MANKITQYIYLIHTREFYNHDEFVYKIGKTKKLNFHRFNQYPRGSVLLFQTNCNDCDICETKIIKLFKSKYKQRKEIGTEYFVGDLVYVQSSYPSFMGMPQGQTQTFVFICTQEHNSSTFLPAYSYQEFFFQTY